MRTQCVVRMYSYVAARRAGGGLPPSPMMLALFGPLTLLFGVGAAADYTSITWTTPTVEPQLNQKGQAVISGGMPVGNGETALLVFPLIPTNNSSVPADMLTPPPPPCKGKLVGGLYCDMGKYIGCHDMSCQLKGEQKCAATTMEACELEVAQDCDKTPSCVAFSIMKVQGHFIYELAHNTGCVLHGFPDNDWEYFVKAKPWPVPPGECHAPAPPPARGPVSMGNFTLPNSVSFLVNMATAMASDTSLFKLGMVSLVTDPPLFDHVDDLTSFEQSLDLETATVTIKATSKSGQTICTSVSVDANSNTITALLNTTKPVKVCVVVQSLHPDTPFTYSGGFGGPGPVSGPDIFTPASTPPGRITIMHRNEDSDQPAAFNYTLEQQGLGSLVEELQGSDRWRHRQFGMTMSGTAGGAPLTRKNASMLTSDVTSTSFEVTVSTAASQADTSEQWLTAIAKQHDLAVGGVTHDADARAMAVATRQTSSSAWWESFWSRSHIVISSKNASEAGDVALLTQQYAICRFVQAIQARTWVPVKFNGQVSSL